MATSAARLKAHNNLRHSDGKVQCQYCPARLAKGRGYILYRDIYYTGVYKVSYSPRGENQVYGEDYQVGMDMKWEILLQHMNIYSTFRYLFYIKLITMHEIFSIIIFFFLHMLEIKR